MKHFKSNYFKTVEDLIAIIGTMEGDLCQRRARQKIVRQFSNGLATMSEDEAKTMGQSEIVNHLTTFKFLYQRKKRLEQTFTSTRTFVEIKVDTDNPEWDHLTSLRMTQAFNKGCLYHQGGEFRNFIKGLAGEIQIAGGAPIMHHKRGGWAPKLALNMLFPRKCGMSPAELTYAAAPEELTLGDLEDLLTNIKGEDGVSTSKKALEVLIKAVKAKPTGNTPMSGGSNIDANQQVERTGSVVDQEDSNRNATIDAWWFYEVKFRPDKTQYVSGTFLTRDIQTSGEEGEKVGPQVIAYVEKLFESPEDWLHLINMDMEIGGDTTLDSVRGIAEIMYPSSSEIELLLNLMLSGDKDRARPKYQVTSNAVADDVLSWDPQIDSMVPAGVSPFDMKGGTAHLMTPMQMLMGNVAGLSSGEVSNTRQGGELRQQAVGRQQDNATMQFGDMADWTVQLENVMSTSVERVFNGTVSQGARGYHQIMWVRSCMEKYDIPVKRLFKREHGQLKYVTVRVRRVLGEGGLDSERSAAATLMGLYPKIAPANRPKILQMVIAIETQDPDLAESLVQLPVPIINAQKLTAENECDTIFRRALLGMPITTNRDDVDMDHIQVHMTDLLAILSLHQLEPWGKKQIIQFSGLLRHTQDHLENVLGDKDVRDEGLQVLPQLQAIVAAAEQIIAQVEQQEGQDSTQAGMTEKERAELELKAMAEHRKGVEVGIKAGNSVSLEKQRLARQQQVGRSNYVRELGDAARLQMERNRQALETARTDAQIAKLRADTAAALNPPAPAAKE